MTYSEALQSTIDESDFTFNGLAGGTTYTTAIVGSSIVFSLSAAIPSENLVSVAVDDANDSITSVSTSETIPGTIGTNILTDTAAPTITAFSTTTANDSYTVGDQINITATASENLAAGAQITVTLNTDTNTTVVLTRDSSDPTKLTGTYTIAAGDDAADLSVASFTLGTGAAALEDLAGNEMTSTTVPTGSNNIEGSSDIVVDTSAPESPNNVSLNGDTLTFSAEASSTPTILDGTTDITNKFDITETSGTFSAVARAGEFDGENLNLTVKVTDAAGNVSSATTRDITVDVTVAAPTIDTVSTDDIINASESTNGFNLTGTGEVGATVTVDGFVDGGSGTTRTAVVDSNGDWTIAIVDADLANDATTTLSATQTDVAGNLSSVTTTDITVDVTVAAPTFALANDTGDSGSDGITNDTTVNVSGLETNATWEYSTNSGDTWLAGTGTSFELAGDTTYAIDAIQVRQTDKAGNLSAAAKNVAEITTDVTSASINETTLYT